VLVLGAVSVGALGLASCSSAGHQSAIISQVGGPAETSSLYPGALLFPKVYQKPNVMLTDTASQPYNIATDTTKKVTLVYFGYTHCPDLCPLNMFLTAASIKAMPPADRKQVQVVFVTTDPSRDTPSVIQTWLDHFNPAFTGLTGTITEIETAERAIGIPLSFAEHVSAPGSSYEIVHAGYVLVYTNGSAHLEFPSQITPKQETHDLTALVQHGWKQA
jgi:protein SCO1